MLSLWGPDILGVRGGYAMKVYKIYDSWKRVHLKREYKTLRTARIAADRMDMVFGGYRYYARELTKTL
jgi:hypothetical protein